MGDATITIDKVKVENFTLSTMISTQGLFISVSYKEGSQKDYFIVMIEETLKKINAFGAFNWIKGSGHLDLVREIIKQKHYIYINKKISINLASETESMVDFELNKYHLRVES